MTRDRSFYRQFFTLCLTLMAERLVVCSVNLLDNIMLGNYAETAMAAAAAVNQLQFLFQQLIYATGAGMVILGGQYWAQGQQDQVRRIVPIGLRWGAGFALVFFLLAALLPRQLVGLFTKDQAMIQLGTEYLRIIKYTCPLFAVTQLLLASLRTVKVVQISLRVSLLSLLVNCGLNYILISGRFGAPALGVTGAAIGTLTARGLECAVVLLYVLRRDRILRLRPADLRQAPAWLARDFARLTAPVCLIEFLWGCNMAIQTAVMGHLSAAAIAAQSISVDRLYATKSRKPRQCVCVDCADRAGRRPGRCGDDPRRYPDPAGAILRPGPRPGGDHASAAPPAAAALRAAAGDGSPRPPVYPDPGGGDLPQCLPSADEHRDYPGRRRYKILCQAGSMRDLVLCRAAVAAGGVRLALASRRGAALSECGSGGQMPPHCHPGQSVPLGQASDATGGSGILP